MKDLQLISNKRDCQKSLVKTTNLRHGECLIHYLKICFTEKALKQSSSFLDNMVISV